MSGFKFMLGDIVRHEKTDVRYRILATPQTHRINHEGQSLSAYLYEQSDIRAMGVEPLLHSRTKKEMEDGRFTLELRPAPEITSVPLADHAAQAAAYLISTSKRKTEAGPAEVGVDLKAGACPYCGKVDLTWTPEDIQRGYRKAGLIRNYHCLQAVNALIFKNDPNITTTRAQGRG